MHCGSEQGEGEQGEGEQGEGEQGEGEQGEDEQDWFLWHIHITARQAKGTPQT